MESFHIWGLKQRSKYLHWQMRPLVITCRRTSRGSWRLAVGYRLIESNRRLTVPAANCGNLQLPANDQPWMQTVCIQGWLFTGNHAMGNYMRVAVISCWSCQPPFAFNGASLLGLLHVITNGPIHKSEWGLILSLFLALVGFLLLCDRSPKPPRL